MGPHQNHVRSLKKGDHHVFEIWTPCVTFFDMIFDMGFCIEKIGWWAKCFTSLGYSWDGAAPMQEGYGFHCACERCIFEEAPWKLFGVGGRRKLRNAWQCDLKV